VRKKKVSQGEVLALAKDLMSFGGRRTIFAILLMLLAGILESISLAFLVPLFAVLTSPNESGFIARMFALALPAGAVQSHAVRVIGARVEVRISV